MRETRSDAVYLEHIAERIRRIEECASHGRAAFEAFSTYYSTPPTSAPLRLCGNPFCNCLCADAKNIAQEMQQPFLPILHSLSLTRRDGLEAAV